MTTFVHITLGGKMGPANCEGNEVKMLYVLPFSLGAVCAGKKLTENKRNDTAMALEGKHVCPW
jgi:hypothetical protein